MGSEKENDSGPWILGMVDGGQIVSFHELREPKVSELRLGRVDGERYQSSRDQRVARRQRRVEGRGDRAHEKCLHHFLAQLLELFDL